MAPATAAPKRVAQRKTQIEHRNEVAITGRLSAMAEARELPSGDEVVAWRIIVDRPAGAERAGIDAVDCVAFNARVRRAALRWQPGETIAVEGALRRRFWRSPSGTASRFEVEVARATRGG
ncbi:MAG TPA: single-stranded DNA-binding protein [Mycobacteriales bacterium]|jgi:single-strand DNA-binding protein|nr:single-stranded DNA-binding protein [Mycobacteriales bacterium]